MSRSMNGWGVGLFLLLPMLIVSLSGSLMADDWSEGSIEVETVTRWYRVFQPEKYQSGGPALLLLHGGGQSMRRIFQQRGNASAHWQELATREGLLLIVPNGTDPNTGDTKGDHQHWNDLRGADNPVGSESDDVLFLDQLLTELKSQFDFDPQRVYVTGASNGGMMTFRMLIEKPERFAAGAAFIASLPMDLKNVSVPDSPTPILICNGTADPLVKWKGGVVGRNRGHTCSVKKMVAWWAKANHCQLQPASTDAIPNRDADDRCQAKKMVYAPKSGGAPVVFVKISGGGHTLPSIQYQLPNNRVVRRVIGKMCHDLEGAELAWEFMQQHEQKQDLTGITP